MVVGGPGDHFHAEYVAGEPLPAGRQLRLVVNELTSLQIGEQTILRQEVRIDNQLCNVSNDETPAEGSLESKVEL